jgi:hypothetical protein
MRFPKTIPILLWAVGCVLRAQSAETSSVPVTHPARGGFTGSEVPAAPLMLGDYCLNGVRTSEGRTDVPRLIAVLRDMQVTDYMHLVWRERSYPHAWDDFQAMAPEFQKAGIRLWLYLTPPSETPPAPFGNDYVRWATECAALAKQYPIIQGKREDVYPRLLPADDDRSTQSCAQAFPACHLLLRLHRSFSCAPRADRSDRWNYLALLPSAQESHQYDQPLSSGSQIPRLVGRAD